MERSISILVDIYWKSVAVVLYVNEAVAPSKFHTRHRSISFIKRLYLVAFCLMRQPHMIKKSAFSKTELLYIAILHYVPTCAYLTTDCGKNQILFGVSLLFCGYNFKKIYVSVEKWIAGEKNANYNRERIKGM